MTAIRQVPAACCCTYPPPLAPGPPEPSAGLPAGPPARPPARLPACAPAGIRLCRAGLPARRRRVGRGGRPAAPAPRGPDASRRRPAHARPAALRVRAGDPAAAPAAASRAGAAAQEGQEQGAGAAGAARRRQRGCGSGERGHERQQQQWRSGGVEGAAAGGFAASGAAAAAGIAGGMPRTRPAQMRHRGQMQVVIAHCTCHAHSAGGACAVLPVTGNDDADPGWHALWLRVPLGRGWAGCCLWCVCPLDPLPLPLCHVALMAAGFDGQVRTPDGGCAGTRRAAT